MAKRERFLRLFRRIYLLLVRIVLLLRGFTIEDCYLKATSHTTDAETVKTLKFLYTSHTRQARDLERKLQSITDVQETPKETSKTIEIRSPISEFTDDGGSMVHVKNAVTSSVSNAKNETDPFDKFWDTVEAIVSTGDSTNDGKELKRYSSIPTALASLPLNASSIDKIEVPRRKPSNTLPRAAVQESFYVVPSSSSDTEGKSTTVPTLPREKEPVRQRKPSLYSNKTLEELTEENFHLKETIDVLTKRLEKMKSITEENLLLKSSIIKFKHDFKRGGKQRALDVRPVNSNTSDQMMERIMKELELLKKENEELKRQLHK